MKRAALLLIDMYRELLGPALHTLVPVRSGCRFSPTCSAYCRDVIQRHGVAQGVRLSARRLAQCHPFGVPRT